MSVSSVKAYARARLAALGYTEWCDGFNWANIPVTKLDTSFHVELEAARGVSNNQDYQAIEASFVVRLFRAPTRTPKGLIDTATEAGDGVISDFLAAANRTTQTGLKNVRFDTMTIEPLDDSNDNGVIIRIAFTALVLISTR